MKVKEPLAGGVRASAGGPDAVRVPAPRARCRISGASSWRSGCVPWPTRRSSCADGSLPLLAPMSQVAGKMAVQLGAAFLQREKGGIGHPARRGPGNQARADRHPRRRVGGDQRRQGGVRARGRGGHHRRQPRPTELHRRRVRRQGGDPDVQPPQRPGRGRGVRHAGGGGPGVRRPGAPPHRPGGAVGHEEGQRVRGRGDRPGRHERDEPPHLPRRPRVRGGGGASTTACPTSPAPCP